MRTGKATKPEPSRYQALLNAIVMYAITETQCAESTEDADDVRSGWTMASMGTEVSPPSPDVLQDPASDSDQE